MHFLLIKIVVKTNTIEYIYNTTGQKVSKIVTENSTITQTNYLAGGFQYKNNVLQFFPHAEGYVKYDQGDYSYVFNYTYHLGNVRVSYSDINNSNIIDADEIVEENQYYPFGLKHETHNSSNAYQYKYQGQEWQNELRLNIYFFKFRMSDPAIGRFLQVDPLSDGYVYNSTYAFAENKVVANYELEGLEAKLAIHGEGAGGTGYTKSDINAFHARASSLEKNNGYSAEKVSNGSELLSSLKTATAQEGSVQKVVIFAHGGYKGVFLNNNDGFYIDSYDPGGKSSASINDLSNSIRSGDIKFEDNASIVFGICNSAADINSIAFEIAETTDITTVGATGYVGPEIVDGKETGNLVTDGTFIKTETVYDVQSPNIFPLFSIYSTSMTSTVTSKKMADFYGKNGYTITPRIVKTDLGNTINPTDY